MHACACTLLGACSAPAHGSKTKSKVEEKLQLSIVRWPTAPRPPRGCRGKGGHTGRRGGMGPCCSNFSKLLVQKGAGAGNRRRRKEPRPGPRKGTRREGPRPARRRAAEERPPEKAAEGGPTSKAQGGHGRAGAGPGGNHAQSKGPGSLPSGWPTLDQQPFAAATLLPSVARN